MAKLKDLKAKWLEDAAVKAEYEALPEVTKINPTEKERPGHG